MAKECEQINNRVAVLRYRRQQFGKPSGMQHVPLASKTLRNAVVAEGSWWIGRLKEATRKSWAKTCRARGFALERTDAQQGYPESCYCFPRPHPRFAAGVEDRGSNECCSGNGDPTDESTWACAHADGEQRWRLSRLFCFVYTTNRSPLINCCLPAQPPLSFSLFRQKASTFLSHNANFLQLCRPNISGVPW